MNSALEALGIEINRESISFSAWVASMNFLSSPSCLWHSGFQPLPWWTRILETRQPRLPLSEFTNVVGADNVFTQRPNIEPLFGMLRKRDRVDAMSFLPGWFAANVVSQIYEDLSARVAVIRL